MRRPSKPVAERCGVPYAAVLTSACAVTEGKTPALITDCKYGFRLDRNELISTLINTAGGPDPYPERGIHAIELYVGVADACPNGMRTLAEALIRPMFGMPVASHPGKLPANGAVYGFDAKTSVMTSFADVGDKYAVRVNEICGKADKAVITLPYAPASASVTDLEGKEIGTAIIEGNTVSADIGAYRLIQINIAK